MYKIQIKEGSTVRHYSWALLDYIGGLIKYPTKIILYRDQEKLFRESGFFNKDFITEEYQKQLRNFEKGLFMIDSVTRQRYFRKGYNKGITVSLDISSATIKTKVAFIIASPLYKKVGILKDHEKDSYYGIFNETIKKFPHCVLSRSFLKLLYNSVINGKKISLDNFEKDKDVFCLCRIRPIFRICLLQKDVSWNSLLKRIFLR